MARQATGAAQRVAVAAEALRDEKFNARRIELAEAALETLGELGFARTSLREIAQNSAFTHGVFHYYFSDKLDLICCCVRHYKAKCVTRYDEVVTSAQSRDELTEGFLAKLAATLRDEARMHRLWYDMRSQAMFEPAFRKDVLEIDKSLEDDLAHRHALRRARRQAAGILSGRALRVARRPVPERAAQAPRQRRDGRSGSARRSPSSAADDLLKRLRIFRSPDEAQRNPGLRGKDRRMAPTSP
ncbi:helix-turn-helix domain-containing protein [Bradyrhizobium sp. 26S5]|uniref:TetR/AcrR family transcriptional regulator n=1 Tax=Bradyrhizobium sp. 26S5 TaxID=3139729 RepID=UPI0030CBA111